MAVGDLSFAFDPTKGETPQTVARKRLMAEAILGNTSHAPRDIGEGLNAVGQAIMYRNMMKGVTGAEAAGNTGAAKVFGSLFGDQFPSAPALSATPPASSTVDTTSSDHPTPPADVGAGMSAPSAAAGAPIDLGAAKGDMAAFTNSMYQSGLNAGLSDTQARLMAAQAAHESGNGVRAPGNNFFGIKAGGAWNGDTQNLWTHEEVNGQNQKMQQVFRKYGSPEQAIQDRIAFMQRNFPDAFNATDINGAVAGLQHGRFGSYATDSNYAQKLQPYLSAITGGGKQVPATAAVNAMAQGQPIPPQQVASLDPSIGMPQNASARPIPPEYASQGMTQAQWDAMNRPGEDLTPTVNGAAPVMPMPGPQMDPAPADAKQAILQALSGQGAPQSGAAPLPDQQFDARFAGAPPAGGPQMPVDPRQAVLQAMIGQNAAPAPADVQTASMAPVAPPQATPQPVPAPQDVAQVQPGQPAPPLPPPSIVQDRPVASTTEPDLSQLPAMAGGNADVVAPGGNGPSVQQLMQAAGDPWVMQKYGPVVEALIQQKMKQGDPGYALDLAKKQMDLKIEGQQLGGAFRGDSIDAQAWNILQTRDPSSKEYQTAYSIVSQPKMQMVPTANGMVQVQVPPVLPGWLKAPGAPGGPGAAPEGAAPNAAQAAPGLNAPASAHAAAGAPPPGGTATASAPIPGTKQPATETQARNGAIGKILLGEVPTLGANFKALADPKGQLLNALPGGIGNAWQDPAYQRAANAVKASVSNVLYSLSGASSNPGEVLNQIGILTPAFGDAPETINDKLQRFKTYVRAISSEANDPELTKSVETAISQMDMPAAPDQNQQAAPGAAPKAGTVDGGYRFKGGDPADKSNWEPVQ